MEVVIKERKDDNGCACQRLFINGKEKVSVYPLFECPEDATIERSLVSCSDIADYMQLAFDAAKAGESLIISTVKSDED